MDTNQKEKNSDGELLKMEISEDMISEKFMKFMKEGKGMRHIYKITLLEAHYNNWLKKFSTLNQRRRNVLMTKKKADKKIIPTAIDGTQSHTRWIKFISKGLITCVKSSAVIIASAYYMFIYDLTEKRERILSSSQFDVVDGIGYLEGAKDENLFAFSEKCNGSGIFIVTYPDLVLAYKLKDRLGGKVMSINFGGNETLLVLKCNLTEHHIVIWSWRTSKVIFHYPCDMSYQHPEIFRSNMFNPSCAILEYYQNKQIVQFWNIHFCGEETIFINRRSSDLKINADIHDMFFGIDNTLYLISSEGNIYNYDYSSGNTNLLISWKHSYTSVEDVVQQHYPLSNLLKQSKGLPITLQIDPQYVKDEATSIDETKSIEIKKVQYLAYARDDYDDSDDPLIYNDDRLDIKDGLKCHMIWFASGIIASGPDGKIKYYKKMPEDVEWMKTWGMIPTDPFTQFVTTQKGDLLFGWTNKYGFMRLVPGEVQSDVLYYFGGKIRDMCFLHPKDSFLLTINDQPSLYIWKKKTGRLLNIIELPCEVDVVLSHFDSPLAILKAVKEGILYGINLMDPRAPLKWPPLKLTRDPLSSLFYLYNKEILVAISQDRKTVILIKVTIETGFHVLATTEVRHEILNFISITSDDCEQRALMLLEGTPEDEEPVPEGYTAGKLFDVLRYPRMVIDKTWCSNNFYRSIVTGPGVGQVLAIPADVHSEIHNFVIDFKVAGRWHFLGCIQVCHQVGNFDIILQEQHLLTYGFDGLVTCYEAENMFDKGSKPFSVIVPHHRYDGGIHQVIIDYKSNYIISRGFDDLVICSRIKLKNRCTHSFHSPKKYKSLNRIKTELKHVIKYEDNFWEDVYKQKRLEMDILISQELLSRIQTEFLDIQRIWHECYAENENEEPENRIPWSDFELNKSKLVNLSVANENEISECFKLFDTLVHIYKAWGKRWEELFSELMPEKLLKLKPFIASYFIENYNQAFKPPRYQNHNNLLRMISDLDAAVFPIPDPKMLPWNRLDDDEEYTEFKLQKFPVIPIVQKETEDEVKEIPEEHKDSIESGDLLNDFESRKKSSKRLPSLVEVKSHQQNVLNEINTDKRKEKEKIIFHELDKIRKFYNEKMMTIKFQKEGQGKTFEEWKKMYIDGKMSDTDSEAEEKVNVLESSTFVDDIAGIAAGKDEDKEEGEIEGEYDGVENEDVIEEEEEGEETETSGGKIETGNTEQIETEEGLDKNDEVDEVKDLDDVLDGDITISEYVEHPEEFNIDTEDSSTFSWGEIDIGIQKPIEIKAMSKKKSLVEKMRQREITKILEFHDLKKKSVILESVSIDPLEEPLYMNGAQSLRLIDASYGRCNEFTLNGLFMSDMLISSLQMIIEELENDFNKRFILAKERKYKDMLRIANKNNVLFKHIDDLVKVCKGTAPTETIVDYAWSYEELLPNIIWEEEMRGDSDSQIKKQNEYDIFEEFIVEESENIEEENEKYGSLIREKVSRKSAIEEETQKDVIKSTEDSIEKHEISHEDTTAEDLSKSREIGKEEESEITGSAKETNIEESEGIESEIYQEEGSIDTMKRSVTSRKSEFFDEEISNEEHAFIKTSSMNSEEIEYETNLYDYSIVSTKKSEETNKTSRKSDTIIDEDNSIQKQKKLKKTKKTKVDQPEESSKKKLVTNKKTDSIKKEKTINKKTDSIKKEKTVNKKSKNVIEKKSETDVKTSIKSSGTNAEETALQKQEALNGSETDENKALENDNKTIEEGRNVVDNTEMITSNVDSINKDVQTELKSKDVTGEVSSSETEEIKETVVYRVEIIRDADMDDETFEDAESMSEVVPDVAVVEKAINEEAAEEIFFNADEGDEEEREYGRISGTSKGHVSEEIIAEGVLEEISLEDIDEGEDVQEEDEEEIQSKKKSFGVLDETKSVSEETSAKGCSAIDNILTDISVEFEERGITGSEKNVEDEYQYVEDLDDEQVIAMVSTDKENEQGSDDRKTQSSSEVESSASGGSVEEEGTDFGKDLEMMQESLEKMMGGAFQLTWQEKLQEEIHIPSFLFEKEPDEFIAEDAELLEKYLLEKANREKLIEYHRKIAEDEIEKLMSEVKKIVYKHDIDILDVLKRKLVTEGCIQSELLKIARIKQKKLIANRTLKNIQHMKDLLKRFHEDGMKLSVMSKLFLKKTALLHNEIDKHQAGLKNVEADFMNKLEPLKLTKKAIEILKNCMKKKPILEAESKIYPSELLAIARSLRKHKNLPYFSEASRSFFKSLEDIDSLKLCPPNMDQETWNILVEYRHLKIISDLKCKALLTMIGDAEKTASLYYKYFVTHLKRYDKIKCHIRDQKIRLEHHCRKIEILLPEGLVESHQTGNIEDFKDCVYISRKCIDNLNKEIVELQKQKETKWKDFDNYMQVVNSAELLHKELRFKLRIQDNLLLDIKTAQINKYSKEFLSEYNKKQKPVYDVKLQDNRKQEKIKVMVGKYFNSYYRSIRNIKDVKNRRDNWIGENLTLAAKNEKLTAENQELLTTIEELNKSKNDDKLQENRNKAIMIHGKLSRKYDSNVKRIDELEAELQRLYMKNYPTFEGI